MYGPRVACYADNFVARPSSAVATNSVRSDPKRLKSTYRRKEPASRVHRAMMLSQCVSFSLRTTTALRFSWSCTHLRHSLPGSVARCSGRFQHDLFNSTTQRGCIGIPCAHGALSAPRHAPKPSTATVSACSLPPQTRQFYGVCGLIISTGNAPDWHVLVCTSRALASVNTTTRVLAPTDTRTQLNNEFWPRQTRLPPHAILTHRPSCSAGNLPTRVSALTDTRTQLDDGCSGARGFRLCGDQRSVGWQHEHEFSPFFLRNPAAGDVFLCSCRHPYQKRTERSLLSVVVLPRTLSSGIRGSFPAISASLAALLAGSISLSRDPVHFCPAASGKLPGTLKLRRQERTGAAASLPCRAPGVSASAPHQIDALSGPSPMARRPAALIRAQLDAHQLGLISAV
uniref:Uncharacterized protein n=1 Tax=Mycena chlorophos TaxID=658473 RepID=A0ABQ0KU00_MYCCL|nr:predicted protein [Mycena chlorophos]